MRENNSMSKIKHYLDITEETVSLPPVIWEAIKTVAPKDSMFKVDGTAKPVRGFKQNQTDKHHPSAEEQEHYIIRKNLNPSYRPRCLDCNGIISMIRCQHSYYCTRCKTERTHAMVLILKHYRR